MGVRCACVCVLAFLVLESPLVTLSSWVAHLRCSGVAARKLRTFYVVAFGLDDIFPKEACGNSILGCFGAKILVKMNTP